MLRRHLIELSNRYPLWLDDREQFVIVEIRLPPGMNFLKTKLLIEIPKDYPFSPPGIGNYQVYVPRSLRYCGRELKDLHPDIQPAFDTPGFGPWAQLCYRKIQWCLGRDNLFTFVEMVRTDLTTPPTQES
jgi:hypothetical protein